MAHKGSTPEEQLLNLIEKGNDPKLQKSKKKKKFSISIPNFLKFLPFKKGIAQTARKTKKRTVKISIAFINNVLIVACSLIVCFSIFNFIFNKKDISKFLDTIPTTGYSSKPTSDTTKLRPFLHYLALVQRRNIFRPIRLITVIDESKKNKETLQDLLKDLVLVGISWDKVPQAMIENKKTDQTYFLRAGESINNLKIEAILENKVMFVYEGEKGELI